MSNAVDQGQAGGSPAGRASHQYYNVFPLLVVSLKSLLAVIQR